MAQAGGRPCKICVHPQRVEIEAFVKTGAPLRQVALRYSGPNGRFSHVALANHVNKHLLPSDLEQRAAGQAAPLWSAKDTVRQVLQKALADLEVAREGKVLTVASALYGQIRGLVETNAKLDGQLQSVKTLKQTINVTSALPPAVLSEFKAKFPAAFDWLIDALGAESERVRNVTPGVKA